MGRPKNQSVEWTGQTNWLPGPKLVEAERDTLEQIRLAVSAAGGVMVMRNNVGVSKNGKRYIRYGLGNGSSDLVCVVGPYGRFLGIEVKRPKGSKTSEDQNRWMKWIRLYGGVTGVAKNVAEALELVNQARRLPDDE
jgi:hypothetical protein